MIDTRIDAGAVVLAAGAGRRMGGVAKALLAAGADSFLAAIARTAVAAGVDRAAIVVVIGPPFGVEVATEAARLGLAVAVNPAPERGMASSVAIGFAALPDRRVGLLWPVDHPWVTAASVRTVALAAAEDGAALPTHHGRGGHPLALGRGLWPELAACVGRDGGVRALLAARAAVVQRIAVDDPGVIADVDDWAALESRP